MSVPDLNKLSDALQQNKLTAEQEAQLQIYLAAHPAQRTRWEEELALNQLLRRMPDAPVSSNFTAQVLQSIRQSPASAHFEPAFWRRLLAGQWQVKLATVLALACAGVFTYHEHQLAARRDLARDLAEMTKGTAATPLELLENFDAIERLNQVPVTVDRELMAALQ